MDFLKDRYSKEFEKIETFGKYILGSKKDWRNGLCINKKLSSDDKDEVFQIESCECEEDGISCFCDENRASLIVGRNFGCIHHKLK